MKKYFLFLGALLVILLLLFPLFGEEIREIAKEKEPEKYTILFAGDVMLDRGVKHMVEKHGEGDYSFPFLHIVETLHAADILFGNLESMISDRGRDMGSLYSFRAEPEAAEGLSFAGFDIVSLANNHAFDYTREAFEHTMEILNQKGIAYTGGGFNKQEAHSPAVFSLGEEMKVGFLGYTEFLFPSALADKNLSGVTDLSEENMKRDIEEAKKEVDFLVVTFHYGDEYQKEPNENQKFLSRKAIDYGADIVIGHHPHVTQPVEKYEGKYIAYSLGNFIFDQYFSKETMRGFLLEIEIEEKEITKARKIHYELNEYYQPRVVREETVGN